MSMEEVARMKTHLTPGTLAESFGLPPGGTQLTLWGRKQLLAREHRGLLGYSGEEVILSAGEGRIRIAGRGLTIAAMDASGVLIRGEILGVEYE